MNPVGMLMRKECNVPCFRLESQVGAANSAMGLPRGSRRSEQSPENGHKWSCRGEPFERERKRRLLAECVPAFFS